MVKTSAAGFFLLCFPLLCHSFSFANLIPRGKNGIMRRKVRNDQRIAQAPSHSNKAFVNRNWRGGAVKSRMQNANSINSAKEKSEFDIIGVATHVGAGVVATVEMIEDIEEIGHAHGMLLLVISRIFRELNLFREATLEGMEDIEKAVEIEKFNLRQKINRNILHPVTKLLGSKVLSIFLCVGALYAAAVEVIEDASPGGHHGAILLAINELLDLSCESIFRKQKRIKETLENTYFRLILVSGATLLAGYEAILAEVAGLGGHHGVLLISLSKFLRALGLLRTDYRKMKTA